MEHKHQEQTDPAVSTDRHHHRHHSHHHRKRSKFRKFIKKHKYALINTLVIVLAVAAVVIMGIYSDQRSVVNQNPATQSTSPTGQTSPQQDAATVQLEISHFTDAVRLIPSAAHAFVTRDISTPLEEVIHRYKQDNKRLDVGMPVTIRYSVNSIPAGLSVVSTVLEVAQDTSFTNARVFSSTEEAQTVDVYHLKTGTRYYYRVSVTLSDNSVTYTMGSFVTEDTPRILSIGGICNVRDIGSWKTADGKQIKQGLLYRGSEMDGAVQPSFRLDASGLNDMLTVLGIRTDMDLRSPGSNPLGTDALGANVEHIYYTAAQYTGVLEGQGKEAVRRIFSDLADVQKYPVYLHCTYGYDRTGTVCYLLEALLGVSEEDLMRDFEMSSLYYDWYDTAGINELANKLREFAGDTMQEKVENYLLSAGVTASEISQIRDIFLEG